MKQRLRDLESKDLWIRARIDELMDDTEWLNVQYDDWCENSVFETNHQHKVRRATEQATREHAEIEAMTLNAQIDNLELK